METTLDDSADVTPGHRSRAASISAPPSRAVSSGLRCSADKGSCTHTVAEGVGGAAVAAAALVPWFPCRDTTGSMVYNTISQKCGDSYRAGSGNGGRGVAHPTVGRHRF